MRSGRPRPIFKPRSFWSGIFCVLFLAAGGAFSCVFGLFAFFTAVMTASFIALNEFGRWSFKTNLVLCTVAAAVVAIAGVFKWTEIAGLYVLFFAISAWFLYFRDRTGRIIPAMENFAAMLADARNFGTVIENAWRGLQDMAPDAAVFIILADDEGALYLPSHFDQHGKALRRTGGTPWKVYASGRPMVVPHVTAVHDQPLDREALSMVCVPITARGEKLGIIQLEAGTPGAFTEQDAAKLSFAAMILGHELYTYMFAPVDSADEPEDTRDEDEDEELDEKSEKDTKDIDRDESDDDEDEEVEDEDDDEDEGAAEEKDENKEKSAKKRDKADKADKSIENDAEEGDSRDADN